MAWFSDYNLAPEVILEETSMTTYLIMMVSAEQTPPRWKQKITTRKFQRRCLTYAAAVAADTFYKSQENTTSIIKRLDESGQYGVEVTQDVYEFTDETKEQS